MPSSNVHLRAKKSSKEQLKQLEETLSSCGLPLFEESLRKASEPTLRPTKIDTLQVNLGKMCNQTCKHCHVDAGPSRKEIMTKETMQACLQALDKLGVEKVDLTGGAPEMNPHFRWFVEEIRKKGLHVMVRSNLTILLAHRKYTDLPGFYARHKVEVISSLPHFMALRTDSQRGKGVFAQSIEALRRLQAVGYGLKPTLHLHLVYNPAGAFLPASEKSLEKEFKHQLLTRYGLRFNRLFAITNMPIARFFDYLEASDNLSSYVRELVSGFNSANLGALMCRSILSVGWDGRLYDCDFNQMLDIEAELPSAFIQDIRTSVLKKRRIRTAAHCYGCTVGAGSSCGGELS